MEIDRIAHGKSHTLLGAKGYCWYCNKRLDEIRRFCNRGCAEAFDEDELAMERCLSSSATHYCQDRAY